jgi:hypothetical protein
LRVMLGVREIGCELGGEISQPPNLTYCAILLHYWDLSTSRTYSVFISCLVLSFWLSYRELNGCMVRCDKSMMHDIDSPRAEYQT